MHSQQNEIIRLCDIGMRYDDRTVLHDVNLTVFKGDFIAITGPNGGGKTTLLKIILKLIRPTSGKLLFFENGKETENLKIGYLPQKNMIDSHFPITVSELVGSGLLGGGSLFHKFSSADKENINAVIAQMGITAHKDMPIGTLSGGQLQRALLGRAIVSSPDVLVLDEPLSYIDKDFEYRMYDILSQLAKTTTILLVSHDMSTIAKIANKHIIIDRDVRECCAQHHYIKSECK